MSLKIKFKSMSVKYILVNPDKSTTVLCAKFVNGEPVITTSSEVKCIEYHYCGLCTGPMMGGICFHCGHASELKLVTSKVFPPPLHHKIIDHIRTINNHIDHPTLMKSLKKSHYRSMYDHYTIGSHSGAPLKLKPFLTEFRNMISNHIFTDLDLQHFNRHYKDELCLYWGSFHQST